MIDSRLTNVRVALEISGSKYFSIFYSPCLLVKTINKGKEDFNLCQNIFYQNCDFFYSYLQAWKSVSVEIECTYIIS